MTAGYRPPGVADRGTAIVLLSGGLDSATVLAIAHAEGWACRALTLRYGQRHSREIEAAKRLARAMDLPEHRRVSLDLAAWGGSSLTGDGEVPHGGVTAEAIPSTYVPARNTVLLSLALAWAEAIGAQAIFLGVSAVDYSGYPDCRPEFIAAFQQLANVATKVGLAGRAPVLRAPLINKSKAETIRWGAALGVDYALTWSCYDPTPAGRPCGDCDSCRLRAKGFADAGMVDPLVSAD
ncbi:MAG: 7-cyano-7-deazaguanine synthase QueC [Candidatus Eisenbacteria sp.]|nr:7-cyano-7-deazaguanine synthase QueC [Candidatus Eisenbacteria bacterium]